MPPRFLPLLVALGAGCTTQAEVAAEMKDAIGRTNEALALSLITVEPATYAIDPTWTLDDGLRHPADGPCPSNEHDTEDPDVFVAELDYGDGCLPRSGLLPTIASGSMSLGYDGGQIDVTLDGFFLALTNLASGSVTGRVSSPDGVEEDMDVTGDVSVETGQGPVGGAVDLSAAVLPDEVVIDGVVELGDRAVELRIGSISPFPGPAGWSSIHGGWRGSKRRVRSGAAGRPGDEVAGRARL